MSIFTKNLSKLLKQGVKKGLIRVDDQEGCFVFLKTAKEIEDSGLIGSIFKHNSCTSFSRSAANYHFKKFKNKANLTVFKYKLPLPAGGLLEALKNRKIVKRKIKRKTKKKEGSASEISKLEAEVAKLKEANALLRRENQVLRQPEVVNILKNENAFLASELKKSKANTAVLTNELEKLNNEIHALRQDNRLFMQQIQGYPSGVGESSQPDSTRDKRPRDDSRESSSTGKRTRHSSAADGPQRADDSSNRNHDGVGGHFQLAEIVPFNAHNSKQRESFGIMTSSSSLFAQKKSKQKVNDGPLGSHDGIGHFQLAEIVPLNAPYFGQRGRISVAHNSEQRESFGTMTSPSSLFAQKKSKQKVNDGPLGSRDESRGFDL